nr:MAG TPA_asm: hypothetical protein [Inoviridae sp.]
MLTFSAFATSITLSLPGFWVFHLLIFPFPIPKFFSKLLIFVPFSLHFVLILCTMSMFYPQK